MKKVYSKLTGLSLVLVLSVVLASCGGGEKNGTSETKDEKKTVMLTKQGGEKVAFSKYVLKDLSDGSEKGVSGETIVIVGSNGKYVSSEDGLKPMRCNREAFGNWELFKIYYLPGGKIALQGNNKKYVSSENGKKDMLCNRLEIGNWEKFQLVQEKGKFLIKGNNNAFVSSEDGLQPMNCTRTTPGNWERFQLYSMN